MKQGRLRWFVLLLALLQLALTVQLARDHLAVFEGGVAEGLLCGGSGRFDCNQVAAHEASWLLGFPIAYWGLLYAFAGVWIALGAALLRGEDRKAFFAAGTILSTMGCAFDVYLGVVMVAQVGTLCPSCLATYALNVLLAVSYWRLDRGLALPLSWGRLAPAARALRSETDGVYYAQLVKGGLALGMAAVAGLTLTSFVLGMRQVQAYGVSEARRFLQRASGPPEVDMARFEGQPSLGPAGAAVTVALVGDFQCSFCRVLARQMHDFHAERPDRFRLFFVNSPISAKCNPAVDVPGHEDACWLAEVGEYAAREGAFWRYHDHLYGRMSHASVTRANVLGEFAAVGLDSARVREFIESGAGAAAVQADLELCRELGLTATPSVVINGHVKRGSFFPWMLRRVIADMLAAAGVRDSTRAREAPAR